MASLLRSQGSMPAEALSMMAPPPAANPGLAMGSGILSALQGQAYNPYLQQHGKDTANQMDQQQGMLRTMGYLQQNQLAAQAQQMRMQQEQMRAKIERDKEQMRRKEIAVRIGQSLLNDEDPRRREVGARTVGTFLNESLGMEGQGDDLIKALASRKINLDNIEKARKYKALGYDDVTIMGLFPELDASALAAIDKINTSGNPLAMKSVGMMTPEEKRKEQADLAIAEAKAVEAKLPREMRGNSELVTQIEMEHRKLNAGRLYTDGTETSQRQAYESVIRQRKIDEERKLRLQSELRTDQILAGVDARLANAGKKPLTPAQMLQLEKQVAPFKKKTDLVSIVEKLGGIVDGLDKAGGLPKGDDVASMLAAKVRRNTVLKGHPSLFQFEQLWGPISIGQIDRNMFDEKGVRAITAFAKQIDAVDNMPSAKSIKNYLDVIRTELIRTMGEDIKIKRKLGAPAEVLEVLGELYAPYGEVKTSPLATSQPKSGPLSPREIPPPPDFKE